MKKSQKKALAVGAGAAALAAAAAGTYLLAGKKGAKNRAKVKKWVNDAEKEVSKQLSKATKVTKQTYDKAVDAAMDQYKKVKSIDKNELLAVAGELKSHWDGIQKEFNLATKKVAKAVKKAAPKKKKKPATKKKAAKKSRR